MHIGASCMCVGGPWMRMLQQNESAELLYLLGKLQVVWLT